MKRLKSILFIRTFLNTKYGSHHALKNKYRLAVIILSGLLMATGCSSPGIYFYKNEKPELILENYLNGTFDAYGMFISRTGQVTRRMHVVMKASWEGDSGVLDEYFTWSDGVIQKRIWHLKKTAPGKYEGRAEDVVGIAYGEVSGNAFHWHYTLAVDVDGAIYNLNFEDWMYLMNDQILLNKAEMTKFGLKVGEVNITFIKRKE